MRTPLAVYSAVALGSALGAVLRFFLSSAASAVTGTGLPLGTLAANSSGSLLITFFFTLTGPSGARPMDPVARQFVMAGILGGFTTFSVFSLETVALVVDGHPGLGVLYLVLALLLWVPGAWVGHAAAERVNLRAQ